MATVSTRMLFGPVQRLNSPLGRINQDQHGCMSYLAESRLELEPNVVALSHINLSSDTKRTATLVYVCQSRL